MFDDARSTFLCTKKMDCLFVIEINQTAFTAEPMHGKHDGYITETQGWKHQGQKMCVGRSPNARVIWIHAVYITHVQEDGGVEKQLENCSLTFLRGIQKPDLPGLNTPLSQGTQVLAMDTMFASSMLTRPASALQTDAFLFAIISGLCLVSAYLMTPLSNKNPVWHG